MGEADSWADGGVAGVVLWIDRYSAYTFRARQLYNENAGRLNRRYSLILHNAMTYN